MYNQTQAVYQITAFILHRQIHSKNVTQTGSEYQEYYSHMGERLRTNLFYWSLAHGVLQNFLYQSLNQTHTINGKKSKNVHIYTRASGLESSLHLLFEITSYSSISPPAFQSTDNGHSFKGDKHLHFPLTAGESAYIVNSRPRNFSGAHLWVINNHVQTERNKMGTSMTCIDQKGENMDLN